MTKPFEKIQKSLTRMGGTYLSACALALFGVSASAQTTDAEDTMLDLISGAKSSSSQLDEQAASLPPLEVTDVYGLEGEPVYLTVRDIVTATLAQNLSIDIVEKDREVAGERVWEELGIYDPTLNLSVINSRIDRQTGQFTSSPSNQIPTYLDTTTSEASLSQRTPLGTMLELFVTDTRTRNRTSFNSNLNTLGFVNPSYESEVGVSVTQPLLKNAGPLVNNSAIRISKLQLNQSNEAFRAEVINRLSDVIRAYWDLDFAIRNAEVQRQAIVSAKELERVNELRVRVGTLPRLSLFQAQAQVAERESLLAQTEAAIIEAQDRLLALMNWESDNRFEQWDRPIIPVNQPTSFLDAELDDEELTNTALRFRPDYQSAKIQVDIADINQRVTKRQMLPELNLVGSYSFSGLENQRSESYDTLRTGDYQNYSFGATFTYPLFNRAARGQYRQAEDQFYQSEVALEELELNIYRDVRSAARRIRTAVRQVEATTRQVKADIEALDAETKRQQVGERTTFDVLDFQDNLAASRANQARAFTDYQTALADLAQAMGITLDVQGIEIESLAAPRGWAYNYNDNLEDKGINSEEMIDWNEILEVVPRNRVQEPESTNSNESDASQEENDS